MNAEKKKQLIGTLKLRGRIDDRGIYIFNDARRLPGGIYGMVIVSIKDETMYLSDTDITSRVGDLLAEIPMRQIKNVKRKRFLVRSMRFEYQGEEYVLDLLSKEINALIDQYAK